MLQNFDTNKATCFAGPLVDKNIRNSIDVQRDQQAPNFKLKQFKFCAYSPKGTKKTNNQQRTKRSLRFKQTRQRCHFIIVIH